MRGWISVCLCVCVRVDEPILMAFLVFYSHHRSVCGGCSFGGLGCCSCRVCVWVSVSAGVVLCRCVCVCDLLIFLHHRRDDECAHIAQSCRRSHRHHRRWRPRGRGVPQRARVGESTPNNIYSSYICRCRYRCRYRYR